MLQKNIIYILEFIRNTQFVHFVLIFYVQTWEEELAIELPLSDILIVFFEALMLQTASLNLRSYVDDTFIFSPNWKYVYTRPDHVNTNTFAMQKFHDAIFKMNMIKFFRYTRNLQRG